MIQNEVLSAIAARRSCRAYKPDLPKPEELQAVLTAGTWAPTAMNRQSPCIVAVQDKATRDKLSAINAAIMGVQSDPFYGAPVVLVVLADASIPTCVEDGALVWATCCWRRPAWGWVPAGSTARAKRLRPRTAKPCCASGGWTPRAGAASATASSATRPRAASSPRPRANRTMW